MFKNNSRMLAKKRISEKKKAEPMPILSDEHGNYQIKAGRLNGAFIARAFPKSQSKARGLIAEATGESELEAIATLKTKLQARTVRRSGERRWEERSSFAVPSEAEFVEALSQAKLSKAQVSMLKAQSTAGADGLTLDQLTIAAGYRSQDSAVKVLGKAGDLIMEYLSVEIASGDAAGADESLRVIAYKEDGGDAPTIRWIMHEELRGAVRAALG